MGDEAATSEEKDDPRAAPRTASAVSRRVLLYGFSPPFHDAFCERGLVPVVWILPKKKEGVRARPETIIYDHKPLRFGDLPAVFSTRLSSSLALTVYRQSQPLFARRFDTLRRRVGIPPTSWVDEACRVWILIHFDHELLLSRHIDTVIFRMVPHEGSDIVLYFLARAMGIAVLLCVGAGPFPAHFSIVTDYRDIGWHRTSIPGPPHAASGRRSGLASPTTWISDFPASTGKPRPCGSCVWCCAEGPRDARAAGSAI